eukprot:336413-Pyramimonas_sp.AAC.1
MKLARAETIYVRNARANLEKGKYDIFRHMEQAILNIQHSLKLFTESISLTASLEGRQIPRIEKKPKPKAKASMEFD